MENRFKIISGTASDGNKGILGSGFHG